MTSDETEVETKNSKFLISPKAYDFLKFVVTLLLPAFSTLYFTLGTIWGLPAVEKVIGTIAALSVFLGVFLKLSTKAYNSSDTKFDGTITISEQSGKKIYSLEVEGDPQQIDMKKAVLFKVSN